MFNNTIYSVYFNKINDLEKEVRYYGYKAHSKNILDLLLRKTYKKYYKKYSELLMKSYINLENILDDMQKELGN